MKEVSPKDRLILDEWKSRQKEYEKAKDVLKQALNKYGLASRQFNSARVEFELQKEEFDNFEKENHKIITEHSR